MLLWGAPFASTETRKWRKEGRHCGEGFKIDIGRWEKEEHTREREREGTGEEEWGKHRSTVLCPLRHESCILIHRERTGTLCGDATRPRNKQCYLFVGIPSHPQRSKGLLSTDDMAGRRLSCFRNPQPVGWESEHLLHFGSFLSPAFPWPRSISRVLFVRSTPRVHVPRQLELSTAEAALTTADGVWAGPKWREGRAHTDRTNNDTSVFSVNWILLLGAIPGPFIHSEGREGEFLVVSICLL